MQWKNYHNRSTYYIYFLHCKDIWATKKMFKKCSLEVSLNCTFSNFSLLMYVPLKASRVVVSYTVASYGKKPQDALSIVLSSSRSLKSDFNANAPDVCCLFVQLFFNKWPSSRHWHSHFTFHTGSFSTSFFFGPKKVSYSFTSS